MESSQQSKQVKKASNYVGSQKLLAELIGSSPSEVSQWIKNIRPIPPKKCVAIEKVTDGVVERKKLCPDDWHLIWPELKMSDKKAAA